MSSLAFIRFYASAWGSFIGLGLLLFTVSLILFRQSDQWLIPLTACMAIPICIRWRIAGFFLSLAFLFGATLLILYDSSIQEQLWSIGIAFCFVLSIWIITSISEEGANLESNQAHQDAIPTEEWKIKAEAWNIEKRGFEEKIATILEEQAVLEKSYINSSELASLHEHELRCVRSAYEELLPQLRYLEAEVEKRKEWVQKEDETEENRQILPLYQQLQEQFHEKSMQLESVRKTLFLTEERLWLEEQRERIPALFSQGTEGDLFLTIAQQVAKLEADYLAKITVLEGIVKAYVDQARSKE